MADKEANDGKFAVLEKQFSGLGHLWANVSYSLLVEYVAACLLYTVTLLMTACTGAGTALLPGEDKPCMINRTIHLHAT